MILRYGPTPKNSDSAINILVDIVQDQSGKSYTMDHYATRYPTNVLDIADFLVRLTGKPLAFMIDQLITPLKALNKPLPPILHYSGLEPYTKYEVRTYMLVLLVAFC
jgi:S-adenosylmethionine synthetase